MTWVSEQDPSEGGKTGGNAQSQIFELPEDAETIKVKLRGATIRRGDHRNRRTLSSAQSLERGRDGGEVMTYTRA